MSEPRSLEQQREDFERYGCAARIEPITSMTVEEAGELVHLLSNMPAETGFMISRCMTPINAPQMFGGCTALVALPGGPAAGAWDNNPARAFRRAWARAHEAAAAALMPKDAT